MPTATPSGKDKDDLDAALRNLDPLKSPNRALNRDVDNAKKVRDTLLGYRRQLKVVMDILSKSASKGDGVIEDMQDEVKSMMLVLDQLEKRKKITADTLLNFMTQLRKMGTNVRELRAQDSNSPFNKNKEDIEDDHKMQARFKQLAVDIGEELGDFIRRAPDKIGQLSGSPIKLILSTLLGPAAPLVKLVDDLVDIDKRTGQLLRWGTKAVTSTATLAAKAIRHPVETGKLALNAVKEFFAPFMEKMDKENQRGHQWRRQIMGRLSGMSRSLTSMSGSIIMGFGAVMGALLRSMTSFFGPLPEVLGKLAPLGKVIGALAFRLLGPAAAAALGITATGDIARNTGSFFEGGLGSRAANYGKATASYAAMGAIAGSAFPVVGTGVGAGLGALYGLTSALVADRHHIRNAVATRTGYEQNKGHMADAARLAGVDPRLMGIIGHAESGFNASAKAQGSSATGLYQFTADTWSRMISKYGPQYGIDPSTPATDPRANALMGALLMRENSTMLNQSGFAADATNLYASHFFGGAAAQRFLSGVRDTPNSVAAMDFPAAAKSNPKIFYDGDRARTFQEVFAVMQRKVGQGSYYGDLLANDAKLMSGNVSDKAYIPTRRGSLRGVEPYIAGQDRGASATPSPKATVGTVPFMPDDNSLMTLNIAGIIG